MPGQTACKIYQFPRSRIVPPAPPRAYERLARAGLMASGVAHIALAVFLAAGRPAEGALLPWIVALGFVVHAVWRVVQGLLDPERIGDDRAGLMKRARCVAAGVGFAIVAVMAARLAVGRGVGADLVATPLGRWFVEVMGVYLLGVGVWQLGRAQACTFMRDYDHARLQPAPAALVRRIGRVGLAGRGVALLVCGGFLLVSGSQGVPVDQLPSGPLAVLMLAIAALGFVAYALHVFVQAAYRRV